jgi:hypothetical protein
MVEPESADALAADGAAAVMAVKASSPMIGSWLKVLGAQ